MENTMRLAEEKQATLHGCKAKLEQSIQRSRQIRAEMMSLEADLSELRNAEHDGYGHFKLTEVKRNKLESEEEKWNDIKSGTEDEMETEVLVLLKLENQKEELSKTLLTTIGKGLNRATEMSSFYDPAHCTERMPQYQDRVAATKKQTEETNKQMESLQAKTFKLAMKEDAQRSLEGQFPSEMVKQFILKDGRNLRKGVAKYLMSARRDLVQMDAETANCTLTQEFDTSDFMC